MTTLNLNHFEMLEAMGLKVVASLPPAMASPPYESLSKSIGWFRSYYRGHTDRLVIW
jgi:hypothetical protein